MSLFSLAVRNFWRHRQRYQVLLSLVALGAALSLVLVAASASLTQTLGRKASQYFGGDVAILGYGPGGSHRIGDEDKVLSALRDSGLKYRSLFRRTVSYNSESVLFFADNALKQRRMIGVDLNWEKADLSGLDFDAGGLAGLETGNGILLSRVTADKLGAKVGDSCTLLIDTVKGSKNTVSLIISGIYNDSSFFGYSSYLAIETLNRALDLPPGTSTEMGMSLDGEASGAAADKLHEVLARSVDVLPVLQGKTELDALQDDTGQVGNRYAVMTLDSRLAQIQQIVDALLAVSAGLNGLFLVIVILGVGNTFRAVLLERTREFGALRALGMLRSRVVELVLTEVAILAFVGGLVGAVVGTLSWTALTLWDWGGHPLASLFLVRGHLVWVMPWALEGALFLVMILAGLTGALAPALRAAYWKPVDALRYHA